MADSEGNQWIQKKREKTDIKANTPLNILKKYEEHPKCLEIEKLLSCTCNQKPHSQTSTKCFMERIR